MCFRIREPANGLLFRPAPEEAGLAIALGAGVSVRRSQNFVSVDLSAPKSG